MRLPRGTTKRIERGVFCWLFPSSALYWTLKLMGVSLSPYLPLITLSPVLLFELYGAWVHAKTGDENPLEVDVGEVVFLEEEG